jgi:RNA polymerase sigma-70 factor (ECF subfamily)
MLKYISTACPLHNKKSRMNESALIVRPLPLSGSGYKFERLVVSELPLLKRYSRRLTRCPVDAEDLLQETILRCWKAKAGFELGTNFGGWTRAIMRNTFFSNVQRRRLEVDLSDDILLRMQSIPASQITSLELGEALRALDSLPQRYRDAVALAAEGFTMDEGADRLGIPINTYKSLVHRGRKLVLSLAMQSDFNQNIQGDL